MLKFKDKSLKCNNFNAIIKLPEHTKITITIYTDASLEGWGASMGNVFTGGAWFPDETLMHINVLEPKAILLAQSHL